ncbi:hypothetical protein GCK72_003742 [Caenorhabditis remanei]|uniref:Uncharacterized protein n=2 Tax=Caenorhabditis remanei TaxID=31234 RepID=E3MXJ3_CAERE|nr:hypothetical protein GCK72_003742 [Caenorhabditis remanei]EFP11574.1 hypothetical protein CRE_28864 [Caenorhabditis remanei]KAF1763797.1 hypothetical protein GCK72_003742 [Caenorhabditis remanei]
MKFLIAVLLASCLLQVVIADIVCNDHGSCTGDGAPYGDTRCGACHSCVYKNCCHFKFTDPKTTCYIPGWRSDEYNLLHVKLPVA